MIRTIFRALNAGGQIFNINSSHEEALEISKKLRTWKEFNPAVFTLLFKNERYIAIVEWGKIHVRYIDLKEAAEFHRENLAMFLWSDPEKKEPKQ